MAGASRRLRIPKGYYEAFHDLVKLSEGHYSELTAALDTASPQLFRGDLATFVADRVSLDPRVARGIVNTLVSLYIVRSDNTSATIPVFVEDICAALRTDGDPRFNLSEEQWEEFSRRLTVLLSFDDSVGITSKALEVMWQNQRVYCDAGGRIVSDVRPVFKSNVSEPPIAAVIVHTLKISYHEGGEVREFYVALDTKDLRGLRELLQREEEKLESLKSVLNAQYLEPESH